MTSARILRWASVRWAGVLLLVGAALAGLNACSAPDSGSARGGVCRVGPDGGPPAASGFWGLITRDADRGIGGTGVSTEVQAPLVTADRGIGGTGIVGVVTGFGSICVDGIEVAYDPSATVDIDGAVADPSQVRVGEVVRILAAGSPAAPRASSISVRIEVAGRIDAMHPASGEVQVAGQRALISAGVPGVKRYSVGDWVAVSGLRRPDGVILASRVETASVNTLAVRGPVRLDGSGTPHLGALALPPGSAKQGEWVHVSGVYANGQPRPNRISADRFCANPYRCFPESVDHLVLEAFLRSEGPKLRVDGLLVPARTRSGHAGVNGFGIVSLERQADGTFTAVDARAVDPGQPGAGSFSAKPHVPPLATTPPSRAGTVPDRATDGDSKASIPTSTVAPEAPEAGPAKSASPEESVQDELMSGPSSEPVSRRRGVPMSSATPAHGKITLISGSASQITTVTPASAGSGGSQRDWKTDSITSPPGPSSLEPSSGDLTGASHTGAARLP